MGAGAARSIDVRVIAATNRRLEDMVREGTFREDLFYRLNVLRIELPPLRERRIDILFLVKRFLDDACRASGKSVWLDAEAGGLLEKYDWPGNVRQLQNLIRRLVAMEPAGAVSARLLNGYLEQSRIIEPGETVMELDAVERQQISKVLEQTGGNKTRAAEILGIQRRTLYKKLARMGREPIGHSDVPKEPN